MKIKCGTDIIEVARIQESVENLGEKFLNRVFTNNEIKYCISKKKYAIPTFCCSLCSKRSHI